MATGTDDIIPGSKSDPQQISAVLQEGDPIKTGNWSNGLFGCFDNMALCALTFVAPCVTFGRMAELLGDECVCSGLLYMVPGLNCYLESQYRERIRRRRGILDSRLMDVLTILLCPLCALTQEANEAYKVQAEDIRLGAIIAGAPVGAFAHTRTGRSFAQPGYPTSKPIPKSTLHPKLIRNSAPMTVDIPNRKQDASRSPKRSPDPFHPSADHSAESVPDSSSSTMEINRE